MKEDIEFIEDKTFLTALPDETIPEKSIEGWFYKMIPASIGVKKLILVCVIILLFAASIFFLLLSRANSIDIAYYTNFYITDNYEIL